MPPAFNDIGIGDLIEVQFSPTAAPITYVVTGKCTDFYSDGKLHGSGQIVFFTDITTVQGQPYIRTLFEPVEKIVRHAPATRKPAVQAGCTCNITSLAAYGCKCGHWAANQAKP